MRDHHGSASQTRDELDLTAHDGSRRSIPLDLEGLTIGRAPGNDLMLDHPSVSRQHARVDFDGTNYLIVDLGSTNGTFLGDMRLLPAVAQIWTPGKTLKIGENRLSLRRTARAEPASPPPAGVSRMTPSLQPASLAYSGPETSRVGLFLNVQDLSVEPGGSTTAMISILNQGELVDHFQLAVSGVPPSWVHIPVEAIRLLPGVSQDIPVVLMPPRSPQSLAGRYGITIQARSRDAPDQWAEAVASLSVEAFHQFDVEIRPQRRVSITSGRFQLLVTNQGNAEISAGFVATDPEELGRFTFQPSTVTVPPGQAEAVHLEVQSRASALPQTARALPFTVSARLTDSPNAVLQVQGEWVQSPPAFELVLHPQRQRGTRQGVFALHVRNSSDESLALEFSAADLEEACTYTFSPQQLDAPPRQEVVAQLRVRAKAPPPGDEPRGIPFTVTARAADAPLATHQAHGEWVHIPPELGLTVEPEESSGAVEGKFTVRLHNRSDAELDVNFGASDPKAGCEYVFDTPQVSVSPGQVHPVRFKALPKAGCPDANPIPHIITVTATMPGFPASHREAQVQWTQVPTAPPVGRTPRPQRTEPAARQEQTVRQARADHRTVGKRRVPIWLWILLALIIAAVIAVLILTGDSDGPGVQRVEPKEPDAREMQPQDPPTKTPAPAARRAAPGAVTSEALSAPTSAFLSQIRQEAPQVVGATRSEWSCPASGPEDTQCSVL